MDEAREPGIFGAELAGYRRSWPGEGQSIDEFEALLATGEGIDLFRRERRVGHFTGSAWLVSADGARVLLTHHRKLNRWLQLGGHADGDGNLAAVALREAEEESGLPGLLLEGGVFDLDRHLIPARGNEPAHWHYDVRFVVRATDENFHVSDESNSLAWKSIAKIAADVSADESMRRMAMKWLAATTSF